MNSKSELKSPETSRPNSEAIIHEVKDDRATAVPGNHESNRKSTDDNNVNQINTSADDKKAYCTQWLSDNDFESIADSSTAYSSSVDEILSDFDDMMHISNSGDNKSIMEQPLDVVQNIFKGDNNSVQTFGNIHVENSNNVHIGNVIYLNGPIHISAEPKQTTHSASTGSTIADYKWTNDGNPKRCPEPSCNDSIFINNTATSPIQAVLRFTSRRAWLAQPPLLLPEKLETPVPYVIISHTATEACNTTAGNVYIVRNIQTFHIESRRWNDIAYNFLIGGDGFVYEGRGWQSVGAHTYGYNRKAIGISFVGCFMNFVPSPNSVQMCQLLIKEGVNRGYIQPNYQLLGHCQCTPVESPGKVLFDIIKTWPQWTENP